MSNAPVKSALPNDDFFMRISVLSPEASYIVTVSGFGGLPVIFIDLIAFAISGFFGVSTISFPDLFDTLKRLSGTFSPESTPFNPAIISDTARELGMPYYAVARKSKKLYMQDGIDVTMKASITTGTIQKLYLSKHDVDLLNGKKVGIVDDVLSTGASLEGLEEIVNKAGGIVHKKAFVLAEGDAQFRKDVIYLATIPIL